MKLGLHAAMFGRDRMISEPEVLFAEMATTGFEGFECNSRFVVGVQEEKFAELMEKYNLKLAALHFAADWLNNPEQGIADAVKVAEYLTTQPSKNIEMSGMWHDIDSTEDIIKVCKNINRAAVEVSKMGIALNYHNHNWEFLKPEIYYALRDYAPDMKFGFDLGWAKKAGWNPIELLKENRGRVQYVHVRDPQKLDIDPHELVWPRPVPGQPRPQTSPEFTAMMNFPDLGDGDSDLKGLINFLNGYLPEDGWMTVEYETGAPDVQRYVRAKKTIDNLLLV